LRDPITAPRNCPIESLYRLFERAGGVNRYIQTQRLLSACSIVSDPADRQSIESVSMEFRFADALFTIAIHTRDDPNATNRPIVACADGGASDEAAAPTALW
jgi:hypothetical protein